MLIQRNIKDYLKFVKDVGIGGIAANLELNNIDYLRYYCPEKNAIGQENYLKFIDYAVDIFGVNNVRSLLIVGIEPLEETLKGVGSWHNVDVIRYYRHYIHMVNVISNPLPNC